MSIFWSLAQIQKAQSLFTFINYRVLQSEVLCVVMCAYVDQHRLTETWVLFLSTQDYSVIVRNRIRLQYSASTHISIDAWWGWKWRYLERSIRYILEDALSGRQSGRWSNILFSEQIGLHWTVRNSIWSH